MNEFTRDDVEAELRRIQHLRTVISNLLASSRSLYKACRANQSKLNPAWSLTERLYLEAAREAATALEKP